MILLNLLVGFIIVFIAINFIPNRSADLQKQVLFTTLFAGLVAESYLWQLISDINYHSLLTIVVNNILLFELTSNLNLVFIILSTFVLLTSLLAGWYLNVNMSLFCSIIVFLEICLICAFTTTNLFMFLLFFEMASIPIFILIAYCGSARRERLQAAYYFLFFTLYGSLFILFMLVNIYSILQSDYLVTNIQASSPVMWLLLFVAFAVKLPLVPFHIWLPYAHVEASTVASIILAAILLKLGGYGIVKYLLPFFALDVHLMYRPVILMLGVYSLIYSSFAAIRQIDLKRQIAFSSIAHMSFVTLGLFVSSDIGIKGSIFLMLSHGLTSAGLFFAIGLLAERYHTRSIMGFSGLIAVMPLFSGFLILIVLANIGFPGTSGFIPELFIMVGILASSPALLFPMLLGMFLTTVGGLILLMRLLFGHVKFNGFGFWTDLVLNEFAIFGSLTFWLIVLGCYNIFNLF